MLKCREVVDLIGSDAWRTASLRRRVSLATHLAMCRYCRAYARSLRRIGDAARALYGEAREDPERSERLLEVVRNAAEGWEGEGWEAE